jgi:hypothetical protein
MKKLILGITTISLLTTGLLADNNFLSEDKSYVCSKKTNEILALPINRDIEDEKNCIKGTDANVNFLLGNAGGLNYGATQLHGSLSNELLKNKGIGIKLAKNWETVGIKYYSFMCSLSKKERGEMGMFTVSNYISKAPKKDIAFVNLQNSFDENYSSGKGSHFVNQIIMNQDNTQKEANANKFFELIMKEKYSEAINFVKEINRSSGFSKIYNDIDNACNDSSNKTVRDLYFSIK